MIVHRSDDRAALQVCRRRGFPVTSAAATLVALAAAVDATTLEDAFETARRNRVVTMSSMRRYLDTYGRRGVRGTAAMRRLVEAVDPRGWRIVFATWDKVIHHPDLLLEALAA